MAKQNPLFRALLASTLLTLLCAGLFVPRVEKVGAAPVKVALPGDIVISEFRSRGPSGATDEFIEIFNRTGGEISLAGWKIRRSSGCGTSVNDIVPSIGSVKLQPGQHYLIGGTGYSGSTLPDLPSVAITLADDGGIAIIDNSNNVIDQVGMCNGTLYKEGTELSPVTSMSTDKSYERKLGGISGSCNDTGNNILDFGSLITPSNPQSSLSPITYCVGVPTFTPTTTTTSTETPTITSTPTETLTPTSTGSATVTPTVTSTSTITQTPLPASVLSILINEVAWAGTSSTRTSDEWIELYNTESVERNLDGWRLTIDDSSDQSNETTLVTFGSTDKILPGDFFLLARSTSGNYDIFTNVVEDKEFTASIPNTGIIILRLYSPQNVLIDTANSGKNSGWYAGTASSTYNSMERKNGKILDSSSAWQTFGGTPFALNRDGSSVRGTPKRANSIFTIVPTSTRTRTPVPTFIPVGRPVINEFLPRPGFDWNQDGTVDDFDEFIEIKNLGPVDINLNGWKLDDEANQGSNPFTLPSVTLKPGERISFYGLQTNILLSDGGDTVRLLNSSNKVYDSYTYKIAKVEDQSICRLFPDGNGSWYEDCTPTPGLINLREGSVPSMPEAGFESPVCDLPDTLPAAFLIAECRGYGANVWRTMFWDSIGWGGDVFIPENMSKWDSFVE
jgi:hypothetical protein